MIQITTHKLYYSHYIIMQHWVLLLCLHFSIQVVPKLEYLRCLERTQHISVRDSANTFLIRTLITATLGCETNSEIIL